MAKFVPSPLYWLIAAFLALGFAYSLATPPFEASDEVHHYPVVREIALGHGLPVQELGVKTAWKQEGSQPPAYYLLAAALTLWIDTRDFEAVHNPNPFARIGIPGTPQNANQTRSPAEVLAQPWPPRGTFLAVYLVRFMSLGMGAGTVIFTYLLARSLFVDPWLALSAALIVAFNPMFIFISASVNNDSLVWMEASLALLVCVHLAAGPSRVFGLEVGERRWHAAAFGLLLGLAALTKISGLVLLPIAGLALAIQACRTRQWRRFLVNGAQIVLVVLVTASWWYWRNLYLYGELLGLDRMVIILGPRVAPVDFAGLLAEWRGFDYSYWGLFGAFSVLSPVWNYGLLNWLVIAGGLGLFWRAARSARPIRWTAAAHCVLLLFIAVTAVGLARWSIIALASQGRLFFTTLAPVSMYLASGLHALIPGRYSRPAAAALAGLLGFLALQAASTAIAPTYLPPPPVTQGQLPPDLQPVEALVAPGIELLGYHLDSGRRYKPGDDLLVTLYWRANEPVAADYNLFLHLLAHGRVLVGNVDTWPGGGLRPTSYWQAGEIYPDRYTVHIGSADLGESFDPSLLRLDVAMWQDDSNRPFPAASTQGEPIPSISLPAGLLEPEVWPRPVPEARSDSTFDGGLALAGYTIPASAEAGQQFQVRLYWQTAAPQPVDYTVFVHVVDQGATLVAQSDGPPLGGFWPTSVWLPGQPVIDRRSIIIKSPGTYRILAGMYDPATVIPLAAYRADGSEWPDRAVDLGWLTVK